MAFSTIRKEEPPDSDPLHHLNEEAFGRGAEADLVDALRAAGKAVVSLVAVDGDVVVGHILFSEVTIEGSELPIKAIGLAPMAVMPSHQNQGIGSMLVRAGIEECRRLGYDAIVVVGHPSYYPRFGFVPARSQGLDCEFDVPDEAWMVLELRQGALDGVHGTVRFAAEFQNVD